MLEGGGGGPGELLKVLATQVMQAGRRGKGGTEKGRVWGCLRRGFW